MTALHRHDGSSIAVFGATGFVGNAVLTALGPSPLSVHMPRVSTEERDVGGLLRAAATLNSTVEALAAQLSGREVVIIAAGLADATCQDSDPLFGANALAPVLVVRAAARAGCRRVVHVSSAVVQGDVPVLGSTRVNHPLSSYGRSKALAELALWEDPETKAVEVVVYRPPSVHHHTRRISRVLTRIAGSRLAVVPAGRERPTPQALLENVASAVVFLAHAADPDCVVHHPWEGMTVRTLMADLGGREPHRLPAVVLKAVEQLVRATCSLLPSLRPHGRRLQLLWFGQGQASSWLTDAGWRPSAGRDRWREMGTVIRDE